jgi:LuxR family maltose regulon positive regulatory protein
MATAEFEPSAEVGGAPLIASKLRAAEFRAGSVPRSSLCDLLSASEAQVVVIAAPPGYGKSTLLAEWDTRSGIPFAWLTLDAADNDPIVLLTYLAGALRGLIPLESGFDEALATPGVSVEAKLLPQLGSAVDAAEQPFALVLEDFHLLTDTKSIDIVRYLATVIPSHSKLVVSGRANAAKVFADIRARGRLLEIESDALRMNEMDASLLLKAAGVSIGEEAMKRLLEETEGWPAGIYLAALAISRGKGATDAAGGRHRHFVAEYLHANLLAGIDDDDLQFLTRSAMLDLVSGDFCDEVLEASGSGGRLVALAESNLFVTPVDSDGKWFRYHYLFREILRDELERSDPGAAEAILGRASVPYERLGRVDLAVTCAQRAGHVPRVAQLVAVHGPAEFRAGHVATLDRWMDWIEEQNGYRDNPEIAAIGAWFAALFGRASKSERLVDLARRAMLEEDAGVPPGLAEFCLRLLSAAQCARGVDRMRLDSEFAVDLGGPANPWWPPAALMLALSHRLRGDLDAADDLFADVIESGMETGAVIAVAVALAQRATIAMDRGDWRHVNQLVEDADSVISRGHLDEYPGIALVHTAAARLDLHRGESSNAQKRLIQAQRLRPGLNRAMTALAIQLRLELTSIYLSVADVAGARTVLRETGALLRRGSDFGTLNAEFDDLTGKLKGGRSAVPGVTTLTPAELRLLPLLSSHLSFPEIGERLFLSRHTIKSQAISIYRKLDVTSRTEAVARAQDLGLL